MKKQLFFLLLLSININVYAQCPVDVSIVPSVANPVCRGTSVTLTANPTNGGAAPQYIWVLNGDTIQGSSTTLTTNVDFSFIQLILISSNGCAQDTAIDNYQIVNTTIQATYNVDVTECNQPVADVEILTITGVPTSNEPFTWNLVTGDGGLGQKDLYPDVPISSYPLFITDATGCTDTSWIFMNTIWCPLPEPSEVITPNDDGYNDMWRIHNIEFYPNNEVYIFDRWGQRVYHKKEYDNLDGWEAKYLGSDMPVSTYYYVLRIKFEKQDEWVYKGAISVFR